MVSYLRAQSRKKAVGANAATAVKKAQHSKSNLDYTILRVFLSCTHFFQKSMAKPVVCGSALAKADGDVLDFQERAWRASISEVVDCWHLKL